MALTKDLLAAGHQVIGLYHSKDKEPALAATGADGISRQKATKNLRRRRGRSSPGHAVCRSKVC
jgi:hypothetical protein